MLRHRWSSSITAVVALVCAFASPAAAQTDTITLAWDASPDSTVVGYRLYAEGPSGYSRTFDVGTAVTFPFTEAVPGQQYCFSVAAYAAGDLIGPLSPQVCGYSDAPPVLSAISDRSSIVGQPASLQLTGSDPDGQAVTYLVAGLPPGLTLQSSTGFISGTPTTLGTYLVTVTVGDGALTTVRTFTWSITALDSTPPSVTITSPTSASSYTTTSGSISVYGSSSDNVGVTQVTWVNSRGGSGTASGRASWRVYSIGLLAGTNVITVTARDAAGNQNSDTLTVTYSAPAGPLVLTSITADRVAPQTTGTSITFTAMITGGTAPQQYKWWVYDGSNWFITRDWTTSNTWTWTPTVANGSYRVAVWVRDGTSTADAYANSQSNGSIAYPIDQATSTSSTTSSSSSTTSSSSSSTGGVLTLTSLTANRPAPQPAGTPITFTATVTGGSSPYQYKWWIFDGSQWYVQTGWSTSNTWTWTPSEAFPGFRIGVWVRNAGSTADAYDNPASDGSIPYPVSAATSTSTTSSTSSTSTGGMLTLISLGADRVAPQPAGTTVTFTATGTGGSAPYQYKFWTYDGANWVARRDWSTSNTWAWTPTITNSAYRVAVWIRNAGSSADAYDNAASNGSIAFPITSGSTSTTSSTSTSTGGTLILTGISPSRTAPSPAGVAVTFTASIAGGIGPQQFKWFVFDGSQWYAQTGWSTDNSWTWTPPDASAAFRVGIWVRNAGSTADMYDNPQSNGSIPFPTY